MTTQDCAFCDRSEFEDRIIYESPFFFVVATLGQFVPGGGYSLVIPKWHVRCVGEMELDEVQAIERLAFRVADATSINWHQDDGQMQRVTLFEHGIAGQTVPHAHIHIVPRGIEMGEHVWSDYPDAQYSLVYGFSRLPGLYKASGSSPYLLYLNGHGSKPWTAVFMHGAEVPAQYLRSVAAEIITGDDERGNWRTFSEQYPEEEREGIKLTLQRLGKHFSLPETNWP